MDDFLEHFRLPTIVRDHYTVHQIHKRGARGTEKWIRVRAIGQGAYGKVWLERLDKSPETRAVKEVPKYVQMDHLKEIRAIAKFSKHADFFANFFGWYDDENSYFLAMEYIPHGSLFGHLKEKGSVPEKEAKEIVVQLLQGLSFMHASNYAHRDLKPGNIFVASPGPSWWVKIGDFGISKRVTDETTLHTTGVYTRTYCAPEMRGFVRDRCETDSYQYTYAVDIWSLGVITFELLTLKQPFPARNGLIAYYDGKRHFPTKDLLEASVSQEGLDFIAKLHCSRPARRPTAVEALEASWLHSYYKDTCENARFEEEPSEVSDGDDEAAWDAVPDQTIQTDHDIRISNDNQQSAASTRHSQPKPCTSNGRRDESTLPAQSDEKTVRLASHSRGKTETAEEWLRNRSKDDGFRNHKPFLVSGERRQRKLAASGYAPSEAGSDEETFERRRAGIDDDFFVSKPLVYTSSNHPLFQYAKEPIQSSNSPIRRSTAPIPRPDAPIPRQNPPIVPRAKPPLRSQRRGAISGISGNADRDRSSPEKTS